MKSTRIAIIGEGGEWSALPLVRELGKAGYSCIAIFRNNNIIRFSKYTSKFFQLGIDSNELLYLKKVNYILKKFEVNKIICIHENLKEIIFKNLSLFKDIDIVRPPLESFEIALNKDRSIEFANEAGVPSPKTYDIVRSSKLKDLDFSNLSASQLPLIP